MFKKVMIASMLSLMSFQGAQAVTLDEFKDEVKKTTQVLLDQLDHLSQVGETLSEEDLNTLGTGKTGSGATELEVLNNAFDALVLSASEFLDYLEEPACGEGGCE
jgi:hypothetical protein